jgi:hypothetical protein
MQKTYLWYNKGKKKIATSQPSYFFVFLGTGSTKKTDFRFLYDFEFRGDPLVLASLCSCVATATMTLKEVQVNSPLPEAERFELEGWNNWEG